MAEIFRKALNNDDIRNIKKRLAIPSAPDVLAAFRTPSGSSQARDVKVRDDETGVVYTFSYGINCTANPPPHGFGGNWHVFAHTKNLKVGNTIVLYRADERDRKSGVDYKIEVRF